MTLDTLRPIADRLLEPCVVITKRLGFTPATVSVVGFGMALLATLSFLLGGRWYLLGAVLVFFNGWLDLLDGALARELQVDSMRGNLLDHVIDRYADLALVVGLAGGIGRFDLGFAAITGVLLTSYLGTQGEALGLDRVYGGLLGRADRLALIGVTAIATPFVPDVYSLSLVGWLLVLFAVVGHLTAIQRFVSIWRAL